MQKKLLIHGGTVLRGSINVQGAKNAALPVLAAALLLKNQSLTLENVPELYDTATMLDLLKKVGVKVTKEKNKVILETPADVSPELPIEEVRKMRASSIVLGSLLARCGKAVLPLPGGCAIGSRPIDFHLKALKQMGATIKLEDGAVHAECEKLIGADIVFDFPSVGATENIMIAAALADGVTTIENAACEPEIENLAEILRAMGVAVTGDGTSSIRIMGQRFLKSAHGKIIPDRIEAITYLISGVMTKGIVTVEGISPDMLTSALQKMEDAGAKITATPNSITAEYIGPLKAISFETQPHPGFPTDAQSQMMAMLCLAEGTSVVHENIFESRLMHVKEFNKMGTKIAVQENTAIITGVNKIHGAEIYSTDLRGGAAMVMMGLVAEGDTRVGKLEHIWRGYENLVEKFNSLGANIELIEEL